jgi:hypothetical protein
VMWSIRVRLFLRSFEPTHTNFKYN